MAYKKSSATRQAIIDASRRLFAEKGYYNTEIKDIAGSLGMAHTAIYYYFDNKKDIASEIYDTETDKIIKFVSITNETHQVSPLFLCILQYMLMIKHLAFNPVTEDFFFDMIDYRLYDKSALARVRKSYYAPLESLFRFQGINKTDDEMTIYILTSDAYAKALLSAIKRGAVDYSVSDALDHFFRHLILPDLGISFDEYAETKKRVSAFIAENPF